MPRRRASDSFAISLVRRDPSTFAMMVFSVAAIITFCFGMPLWYQLRHIDTFSHLFSVVLLGVLPVGTTMLAARMLTPSKWQKIEDFTCWDWMLLTLGVIVGQWALFMAISMVVLFLVSAQVMDQVGGAFFYYMVPLSGAGWLAMGVFAAITWWTFHQILPKSAKRLKKNTVLPYAKSLVLAAVPVSLAIYGAVQWLFYHFVPG